MKGKEREKLLGREIYFSPQYFHLRQLCSFAHQIHDIYHLSPFSVLEVGIGNGFTSAILKQAGLSVTTADINPELGADHCASIHELPEILPPKKFDLVVCCEVLEHLLFAEFDQAIEGFKKMAPRHYLTLPVHYRTFGFGGFVRLSWILRCVSCFLEIPIRRALTSQHFWEVNSEETTGTEKIKKTLLRNYPLVKTWAYALNPYHRAFVGLPAEPK